MAKTQPRGIQLLAGSVQRGDMDVSTVGSAVITKIIQGSGVTLSSTGGDAGTGDVTLAADGNVVALINGSPTFNNLTATGNTTLNTSLTGVPYLTSGVVANALATQLAYVVSAVNSSVTDPAPALTDKGTLFICNKTTANTTVTLPASPPAGWYIWIRKGTAPGYTVATSPATTVLTAQTQTVLIVVIGGNYQVLLNSSASLDTTGNLSLPFGPNYVSLSTPSNSVLEVNSGTNGNVSGVQFGLATSVALANPSTAPTVTTSGTAGTSTWKYCVVANVARNGSTLGNTVASPIGTVTTGNAVLSATNYNIITFTAVPGATSYSIYRTAVGTSPNSTGLIASGLLTTVYNDNGLANGGGETPPTLNTTGRIVAQGDFLSKHLLGNSSTPTIVNGAGAGTTPGTPTVTGTDTAGSFTVITGTAPTTNAVVATITYNSPFPVGSTPIFYAGNAAAGNLTWEPPAAGTTTGFTISSAANALAASTTYIWNYHVIGR